MATPTELAPMSAPPLFCIEGALTIAHAQTQREGLLAAVEACEGELVLDLAGVEAFDSSGVQLLLAVRRTLNERGAALRLKRASRVVDDVLQTYGLKAALPCDDAATGATG